MSKVLAPFNPTSEEAQQHALRLLDLQEDDVLYDFGCGDGRFIINAAQQTSGLKCVGIELDDKFSSRACKRVKELGLQDRIQIIPGDIQDVISSYNYKNCTAAFVYLLPKGLDEIKPILRQIKESRNGRVVSYMFQIPGWIITECIKVDKGGLCKVYLYK